MGLLYKVRKLCSPSALISLYFTLFNLHLSYLIYYGEMRVVKILIKSPILPKFKSLQRRVIWAVRTIPGFFDTDPIFFDLKILNFEDQYKLQLSSLIWDHGTIPPSPKRTNTAHNYKTREAAGGNLYYTKVISTKYGVCSFNYQGIPFLNSLKKLNIYKDMQSKKKFAKDLKSYFLLEYRQ